MENIKLDFTNDIKVSNLKLTLLILSMPLALLPVWLLIRLSPDLYNWLPNHTKGFITPTLVLYLVMYFIFVYLMMIKNTRLSLIDLGLNKNKLKNGIILTLVIFIILQVYGGLYSYFTLGKLSVSKVMTEGVAVLGYYLELIFGVALFEEVVYKGVLIPQIFIRLNANKSKTSKMFLALVISQFLFSISHIPVRLANGTDFITLMISLAAVFVIGVIFAFIYILTGNLFISMGVHVIWDASQNNAATFYNSRNSDIVIGLCVFIFMYVIVIRNQKSSNAVNVSK